MRKILHTLGFLALFIGGLQASPMVLETAKERLKTMEESYFKSAQNGWLDTLESYRNFEATKQRLELLESTLSRTNKRKAPEKYHALKEEIAVLTGNLQLYGFEENTPFYEVFAPFDKIEEQLSSTEQSIIGLISTPSTRLMKTAKDEFKAQKRHYDNALVLFEKSSLEISSLQKDIEATQPNNSTKKALLTKAKVLMDNLKTDERLLNITHDSLEQKMERLEKKEKEFLQRADRFKKEEFKKFLYVFSAILILYIFVLLLRNAIFRYGKQESDEEGNQRYFVIKRLLNILFVFISLLIVAFAYISNVAQALAIFGVIGAGLTIVMKEWVLSFVGWFTMMTGSHVRLGDRIKIDKDGKPIIGDVVDISLTRITLYENITNDSVTDLKKAGRIIFVPNYYVIFYEVYNYTHISMKTIIDLVEISFSFESNFDKAEKITLEIVENLSGRYTDMARRQYEQLKGRYTLRNMPSYPKVVFYPSIKGDGVTMGIWYITPYREILRIKTDMTKQVIEALRGEKDIDMMYTGSSMYLEQSDKDELIGELKGE